MPQYVRKTRREHGSLSSTHAPRSLMCVLLWFDFAPAKFSNTPHARTCWAGNIVDVMHVQSFARRYFGNILIASDQISNCRRSFSQFTTWRRCVSPHVLGTCPPCTTKICILFACLDLSTHVYTKLPASSWLIGIGARKLWRRRFGGITMPMLTYSTVWTYYFRHAKIVDLEK
jgi:hypothetical protein